ncbi:hypothetical protein PAMP_016971 [Pampus punctatissimus]
MNSTSHWLKPQRLFVCSSEERKASGTCLLPCFYGNQEEYARPGQELTSVFVSFTCLL